jgi:hypothetical protein
MSQKITRRQMIRMSAGFAAAAALTACKAKATEVAQPTEKPVEEVKATEKPAEEVKPTEKPAEVAPTPAPKELLVLNCTTRSDTTSTKSITNSTDVVSPYIEKKFNVQFNVFIPQGDMPLKEYYALNKAAGTLPQVMMGDRQSSMMLGATGDFHDLTDYLPAIPNYTRWLEPSTWPRWKLNGRNFGLPQVFSNGNDPIFKGNVFYEGFNVWPLLMREDILTRVGYKLTPLADIAKDTTDKGIWPTYDQLAIEPAIDTPEKFDEFLRKVKAENIMVGDKPLAPLCSSSWSVFHISSMMDNGHWRIHDDGSVDAYMGQPGAHDWYKLWSSWYQEDLLDKDYVTQKDDQLQEKWATGRIASGLFTPDLNGARQAMQAKDPTAMIRPVQWPKQNQRYGFFDVFETGFWTYCFSKELEDMPRVMELVNWLSSDESMLLHTWGPEEAGLYVEVEGKRQWKDEETRKNIMGNIIETKNAGYYGLAWNGVFSSKAYFGMPMVDGPYNCDPRFNYPPVLSIFDIVPRVLGQNCNMGYNTDGRACYGDGGENTNAISNYFWSFFQGGDIAKLLTATSDSEFEAGWEEIQTANNENGQYDAAVADMTKWFAEFGPKA